MQIPTPYIAFWEGTAAANANYQYTDCGSDCDCGGACDCACPVSYPQPPTPVSLPSNLRPHPALQRLPLDERYAVAFVPSFSHVVVINAATWHLLQGLPAQDHQDTAVAAVITECYHSGLLIGAEEQTYHPTRANTLIAWLHVTRACNLRCTYCYLAPSGETMTEATGYHVVDAIFRSARAEGFTQVQLKYAGGEATLNLQRVAAIHRYACARGQALGISVTGRLLSNGTTLTNRRLALIAELGLQLMVSLDGLPSNSAPQRPTINGQASTVAALAGIERALACGLQPTVSVTITPASASGLPQLIAQLLTYQLPFTLNFARPTQSGQPMGLADEERIIQGMRAAYAVIATQPPRHSLLGTLLDRTNLGARHDQPCAVGTHYLVFDPQGRVAPCQMTITEPITDAHAANPLALVRADQRGVQNLSVTHKEACQACPWRYWCAGGCALVTHRATGRYDARSPNCRIYQALYPDLLRLEGLRLLQQCLSDVGTALSAKSNP